MKLKFRLTSLLCGFFWIAPWSVAHADLAIGQTAPAFSSTDELGLPVTLSQFKGKTVILYFYPKDGTPGCTKEAQSFRDHYTELTKLGVVVLGISFDDADSHKAFKNKETLPFPLLTSNQKAIAEAYGVGGIWLADRDTIVIGKDGKIKNIYRSVTATHHATFLISELTKK